MIDFGREICNDFNQASQREWIITNGLGSYASGTISGLLTRRYHGLLIAATNPPLGRTLLVANFEETITYDKEKYSLFTRQSPNETVNPLGYELIEHFQLEGTTPVWTYACGEALLEKKIWMVPGSNTTYIQYTHKRGNFPIGLEILILINSRDHHSITRTGERSFQVHPVTYGYKFYADNLDKPFYLFCEGAEFESCQRWESDFYLNIEAYRGLPDVEDHFAPAKLKTTLQPAMSITAILSTDEKPIQDSQYAYRLRTGHEKSLLAQSQTKKEPDWYQQLILASDQFIVERKHTEDPEGRTVIAGYPWFGDWGRDTMISLVGLTISTRRYEIARQILVTFSHYLDQGMLPNNFIEFGETPGYNTVDATLWYLEAMRAYHQATGDTSLIAELFPSLEEIIYWHKRGTRYQIHEDPQDGLIYAGEDGVQLTWMDAKVNDWVVTPRIGKAIEINALWFNALQIMANFCKILGKSSQDYLDSVEKTKQGFQNFWNPELGYCYDLLDEKNGNDSSLRPNQLFAVSLPYTPIDPIVQKAIVDTCSRFLLTSHGLRSLSPVNVDGTPNPEYIGHYGGDLQKRDAAYHQGTVWAWLIGPFISAHLRVYKNPKLSFSYLQPVINQMNSHGIGSISEIFDGDAPFTPRGCIAQAWSVAEVLRVLSDIYPRLHKN